MSFHETPEERPSLSRRSLGGLLMGTVGLLAASDRADADTKAATFSGGGTVQDHFHIERLLYRYATALDSLDAPALAECFAPNGVLTQPDLMHEGNFAGKVIDAHRSYEFTMHIVLNHMYTIREATATGVSYGVAIYLINGAGKRIVRQGYMHYYDELVKQRDSWLFLKRHFEPIFLNEDFPVKEFFSVGKDRKRG